MNEAMELRKLGDSDLRVSAVGLGCWQFSQGKGIPGMYWPVLSDHQVTAITRISLDNGINWFDTAEAYGWGASERVLSLALAGIGKAPEEIVMATKWSPVFRTARSLTRSIDKRLEALHPYGVDLYQIHHPYSLSSVNSQMQRMVDLVKEKKIRYVGVSNFSAKKMALAHRILQKEGLSLVSNQVKYNLLYRRIESNGIMDTARELGITIIAYSPLAQGILSGKFHRNPQLLKGLSRIRKHMTYFHKKELEKSTPVINLLEKLAAKYQVTPAQIALNWLIHFQGEGVVVIPGATHPAQAEENARAMSFKLSRSNIQDLQRVSDNFR